MDGIIRLGWNLCADGHGSVILHVYCTRRVRINDVSPWLLDASQKSILIFVANSVALPQSSPSTQPLSVNFVQIPSSYPSILPTFSEMKPHPPQSVYHKPHPNEADAPLRYSVLGVGAVELLEQFRHPDGLGLCSFL